jgi:hypothetical protein
MAKLLNSACVLKVKVQWEQNNRNGRVTVQVHRLGLGKEKQESLKEADSSNIKAQKCLNN